MSNSSVSARPELGRKVYWTGGFGRIRGAEGLH
jgi:hypothetical protein